jgi:hypothetical protein
MEQATADTAITIGSGTTPDAASTPMPTSTGSVGANGTSATTNNVIMAVRTVLTSPTTWTTSQTIPHPMNAQQTDSQRV